MADPSFSLRDLESFLAERPKRLGFPPALENLYEQEMDSYRQKVMSRALLPVLIIYNAFLAADALLLPETVLLAASLHLLVVTPIILAAAFFNARARRQWPREVAATAVPLMMLVQIMFIYARNEGVAADQYQYFAVMIVIFMNVNQRFGFRLAVVSTLLLMATYATVLLSAHSPFEVKFTGACLMTSAAYLSLMANRRMEQEVRHNFLRRLRDQMRREGAEEVSKRDALTGLPNRRKLDEWVKDLWAGEGEQDALVAVVMADIDHFKPFNDRYGHAAGDACLKRVAGAITTELRNGQDLAVRLGGEEFLLLLPSTDMSEAVRIAERVRREIEKIAIPHEEFGPHAVVTASLGVSAGPLGAHSFEELLAGADAALYAAKRTGRNAVWPPFVTRNTPITQLREELSQRPHQLPLTRNVKSP